MLTFTIVFGVVTMITFLTLPLLDSEGGGINPWKLIIGTVSIIAFGVAALMVFMI